LFFLFSAEVLISQVNVTTLGIQLKPLFSSGFVGAGMEEAQVGEMRCEISPASGLNYGMVVRRGLSKAWSMESGICFVRRNFELRTYNNELSGPLTSRFRLICYEIPLQALVFVKLGEKLYMNGSGGVSFDVYPSDVETFASENIDSLFFAVQHRTFRRKWLQTAMLINYGFEYRTARKGYFYLGASYHRGFQDIATSLVRQLRNNDPEQLALPMSGNYLTVDFRYFFNEKAEYNNKGK
ncbi:MAG: outer membrane beta-barrel protein, partial [Flavobacteriales bacterium]